MDIKRILAVTDPTTENQRALARAADFARRLNAELVLFACDYVSALGDSPFLNKSSQQKGRKSFLKRKQKWLEDLAQPLREEGLQVACEAVWGKRYYEEAIRKCLRSHIDLVVKATEHHSKIRRTFFSSSDWHLIRECPAKVLLVKLDDIPAKPQIIAAVDPVDENDVPRRFDQKIMQTAQLVSEQLGARLNVLHWYESPYLPQTEEVIPEEYKQVHEEKLAALVADYHLTPEQIFLRAGETEKVLTELVHSLPASMVIMGVIARDFLTRLVIGSTAERVLDRLPCDILLVKPDGYVSPVKL